MMKKIGVGIMGLVIAVMAGTLIQKEKEIADAKVTVAGLEQEVSKFSLENKRIEAKLAAASVPADDVVVSMTPSVDVAEPAINAAPLAETEEPREIGTQRMMRNMSKMMDNPAMNKMMAASQRGALDVMYSDLADQLGLKGEEKEYFMELLLSRQMSAVEVSMKMMGGGLSAEEKAQIQEELKATTKQIKDEIKYFLNSEADVAEWEFYEKTIQERMMLSQVEQTLGDEAALSDQTYRQLLEAIHEEKTSFDFSSNLADDENLDLSASRFSPENIKSFADDLNRLNEIIAVRAQTILTPEQFAAYMESQTANTELQISQLEMAGQMFGAKQ